MRLALVFLVACGDPALLPPVDDGGVGFPDEMFFPPPVQVDSTVCTMVCGGNCTDTASDPMNCGSCGHACSGAASECAGSTCVVPQATRWAIGFPGQVNAVAVDEFGHVFAAGAFTGTLDLGQGIVLTSAGDTDAFYGEWTANGVPLWVTRFGGAGADTATAMTYANGSLFVGLSFSGAVPPSGFTSHGGTDVLVFQLSSDTGAILQSNQYGSAGDDTVRALAFGVGGMHLCGAFGGTSFSFSGGTLTSQASSTGYVAPFIGAGLTRTLGDRTAGHTSTCTGIAMDSLGLITVAGTFDGSATFGNTPVTVPTATGFVASYQPTNLLDWVHVLSGGTSTVSALALDADNETYVVGNFSGTVDFGNGPLTASTASDGFLVGYTRAGSPILSRRYADAVAFTGIAFAGGDVLATGRASTGADFGASLGGDDLFLARLSGTAVAYAKRFGGAGADGGTAITVDHSGSIVVAGSVTGSVDVGTGPLTGPALLLELDP